MPNRRSLPRALEFMRGNMLVFSITRVLGMFGRRMAFTYASLFILALGGEPAQIGLINSLRPLSALLVFPIGGYLADRVGRVKLIGYTGIFSSLIILLYALAPNWRWLAWASLLRGLTVISFPASSALVADSLSSGDRGRGFAVMNTISSAPSLVAPYLAGLVLDATSVEVGARLLYAFLALASIVSAVINLRFLKEIARPSELGLSLSELPGIVGRAFAHLPQSVRELPRPVRPVTAVIIMAFLANAIAGPFWVVFAVDRIGLTSVQWGSILLVETALRNAVAIPAGVLVDRYGRAKCMRWGLAVSCISVLLFVAAHGFWPVLAVRASVAVVNAFFSPACGALVADLVPREMRGRVMALIGRGSLMLGSTGGGVGGPSLGLLVVVPLMIASLSAGYLYTYDAAYPWYLSFVLLSLCALVALLFVRDPSRAHE